MVESHIIRCPTWINVFRMLYSDIMKSVYTRKHDKTACHVISSVMTWHIDMSCYDALNVSDHFFCITLKCIILFFALDNNNNIIIIHTFITLHNVEYGAGTNAQARGQHANNVGMLQWMHAGQCICQYRVKIPGWLGWGWWLQTVKHWVTFRYFIYSEGTGNTTPCGKIDHDSKNVEFVLWCNGVHGVHGVQCMECMEYSAMECMEWNACMECMEYSAWSTVHGVHGVQCMECMDGVHGVQRMEYSAWSALECTPCSAWSAVHAWSACMECMACSAWSAWSTVHGVHAWSAVESQCMELRAQ